jgi:4-diphosphocytidyl-2-C-methyl-D-erythritol kinase
MTGSPLSASRYRAFSDAKVNLGLFVLGKRPDGYHEVCTLYLRIPLHDEWSWEPADRFAFHMEGGPSVPLEENLAWRAAQRFQRRTGMLPPYRLTLHKRIPHGAGLGGGSADAAWMLQWLNRMTGFPLTLQDLQEEAQDLGSDVPFFLYETPLALGTGRGEQITPLPLRAFPWVLWVVVPHKRVSTAGAYARLRTENGLTGREALARVHTGLAALEQGDVQALEALENVFFPYLMEDPRLREIADVLRARGAAWVSCSGSGSAILALFPENHPHARDRGVEIPEAEVYIYHTPPIHPLLPQGEPQGLPGVFLIPAGKNEIRGAP